MELTAPLHIHWEITNECNFNCMQCYQKNDEQKSMLSSDEILAVATKIIDANIFQVSISGGEPFMVPVLYEVLRKFKENNLDVLICSNGSYIHEKDAQQLKEYGIPVQISLDSYIKDKNNIIRGNSEAFDLAIGAIQCLVKNGVDVSVAFCASRFNYMDFLGIARLCSELNVKKLVLGEMLPVRGDNENQYLFSKDDYVNFLREAKEVKESLHDEVDIYINCNWGFIVDDSFQHAPCTALDRDCAILYNGIVVPCPFIRNPEYYLGNVLNESIEQIWCNSKNSYFYKYKHCGCDKDCSYYTKCMSGCKAELANKNLSLERRDPRCIR